MINQLHINNSSDLSMVLSSPKNRTPKNLGNQKGRGRSNKFTSRFAAYANPYRVITDL